MRDSPTFSIVLVCYNAAPKLRATLDSIVAQAGAAFECVVVDGGSQDGSVAILQQYADAFSGIIQFTSEGDGGVYDAMNKGIALAKGRYLYFLGAGDEMRPLVLAEIAQKVPSHTRAMVYGDVIRQRRRYGGSFNRYTLCLRNISHQAIFYGRDVFALIGHYETQYPVCADWIMNIRCFGDDRIYKLYVKMLVANFEEGGLSSHYDEGFEEQRVAVIRKHLGFLVFCYATWRATRTRIKKRVVRYFGLA